MTCSACGDKPKKDKSFTKAVVEINNPGGITLIRKVVVPASMGDDTAVPPVVGKYKNVLLYYEANSKVYLYSSDGIPTQLVNGVTDYEAAVNLPMINDVTLIGNKSAADLKLADAPMIITVANDNTSWSGADTAEDVYNFFLNKGKVNIVFNGGENYAYEITSAAYIPEEEKMMCIVTVATATTVEETTEFDGNALFGIMTLYTADKAIDLSQIELQPKLFVTDFTGLDLNYNELSGVPATTYSIGMVKPGNGLEIDAEGVISVNASEAQSDWDQSDNTQIDYIKNKPTIPAPQVQSDWDQADDSEPDFIKNKPSITPQVQADWSQSNSDEPDYIKNKPSIPVGSYSITEIATNDTWIDDSTIYKKTINTGALPNATTSTISHGISGISKIIKIEGYALDSQNVYFTSLPDADVNVFATDTNIIISTSIDRSAYTESYITLYYIKSS